MSALEAAGHTVQTIMRSFTPPYHIMVSGGVDSQAMLYAWHCYGDDFIPISVVYNKYYNQHDLATLDEFASEHRIPITYQDFDLLGFYQTRYHQLCEKYRCTSPHFGAHLGMIENLPGTCVFAGDRLFHGYAAIQQNNFCLLNAANSKSLVPFFFLHTPELAYSQIRSVHYELVNGKPDVIYSKKVYQYQMDGFPVIAQRTKYTGFEKIKDHYDQFYKSIDSSIKLKYATRPSQRAFDLLLRYPYEDKYGRPQITHQLGILGVTC